MPRLNISTEVSNVEYCQVTQALWKALICSAEKTLIYIKIKPLVIIVN